jgi:type IV secretion system protein VirB9
MDLDAVPGPVGEARGLCRRYDGSERLARQHGTGDFVVVEEIAAHFRLRLGPSVLDIINTAYDPAGKPTGTGTTAPTVQRDILQAKAR